jgi:hypothetical protein
MLQVGATEEKEEQEQEDYKVKIIYCEASWRKSYFCLLFTYDGFARCMNVIVDKNILIHIRFVNTAVFIAVILFCAHVLLL